jgi:hypothetical protein
VPGKRITIIPRAHRKLTRERKRSEPDRNWVLEKGLERHPAVRAASRKRLAVQKAVLAHT